MNLTDYKHLPWTDKPNKRTMPTNLIQPDNIDEFNAIYKYIKSKYTLIKSTASGGIPYNHRVKYLSRYIINRSSTRFEIVLVSYEGCYKFQFGASPKKENNPITGTKALKAIYKTAEKFNIDLDKYKCKDKDEGLEIKKQIESPDIRVFCLKDKPYVELDNVHHLDLNSSYASRIVEAYPELRPMYEYMYNKRKENDGYYKHVLTNSIGCMQSEYCLDNDNICKPYLLAKLAKIAVNGTRDMIANYLLKLILSGRKIISTNTDGIWYQGEIYHDENEGTELGQYKNDHVNCRMLIKSKGAYQFIENGKVHTVVRGITNLDKIKDRDNWQFGDILNNDLIVKKYNFNYEEGVVESYEKV